ncbi:hypothetical protein HK098_007718 [Nowakowskiella sp. JEL0407]|nr:hypothetical protein HK098_007718 [Nowakowskiella sp. JEL0407]
MTSKPLSRKQNAHSHFLSMLSRRFFILHTGIRLYLSYKIAQWIAKVKFKPPKNGNVEEERKELYENDGDRGVSVDAGVLKDEDKFWEDLHEKNALIAQVFEEFDDIPLAVASIVQVHKAKLRRDWKKKFGREADEDIDKDDLWHEYIGDLVMRDIQDLTTLVKFVGWAEPDWDFTPIVTEWTREVPKELDFRIESSNTTTIRDSLYEFSASQPEYSPLHTKVKFADPINALTTERILTMNYINGIKLSPETLTANNVNTDDMIREIIKSYAYQIYVLGFWNSDPHPGNFLIEKNDLGQFIPVLLDFGLTKRAERGEIVALSRILLAAKNMDFSGLLSGFQQLGLNVPSDDPQDVMDMVQFLFRRTSDLETTKREVEERFKEWAAKREENKKKEAEENIKKDKKLRKVKDAFPSVLIFFGRVMQLLRGLSLSMESQQNYLEIMTPFAQYFLEHGLSSDQRYGNLHANPASSPEEESIRTLVHDLIDEREILGIQVVAMQNGKTVVDIAAGVQGQFDPTFITHDTLFPVFSCTKPVAASVLHVLVQRGKLKYSDPVYLHWPDFVYKMSERVNNSATYQEIAEEIIQWKKNITVGHILSHRSGLHAVGTQLFSSDPWKITNFQEMCAEMELAIPEFDPNGTQEETQVYHMLSFGWLVGGLVEKVTGQSFSEVVTTELFKSLKIENEAYIGIPAGVDGRLAEVYCDFDEIKAALSKFAKRPATVTPTPQPASPTHLHPKRKFSFSTDTSERVAIRIDTSVAVSSSQANKKVSLIDLQRKYSHLAQNSRPPSPMSVGTTPRNSKAMTFESELQNAVGEWEIIEKEIWTTAAEDDESISNMKPKRTKSIISPILENVNPFATNPSFFNNLRVRRAVIPAANGHFSARALCKIIDHITMCQSNNSPNNNIFTPETVNLMRNGAPAPGSDDIEKGWGFGFKRFTLMPSKITEPTYTVYGHGGMGGSVVLSDLKTGVSLVVVINKLKMMEPTATIKLVEKIFSVFAEGKVKEWSEGADIGREEVTLVG